MRNIGVPRRDTDLQERPEFSSWQACVVKTELRDPPVPASATASTSDVRLCAGTVINATKTAALLFCNLTARRLHA